MFINCTVFFHRYSETGAKKPQAANSELKLILIIYFILTLTYSKMRHKNHKILLHASSSINTQHLSVNPLTVLASKEADNTSNINWKADTVKWGPGSSVLLRVSSCLEKWKFRSYLVDLLIVQVSTVWNIFSADFVVHVGLDSTWSNAVDSDLLVTHI